jgi:hypothetical protein
MWATSLPYIQLPSKALTEFGIQKSLEPKCQSQQLSVFSGSHGLRGLKHNGMLRQQRVPSNKLW